MRKTVATLLVSLVSMSAVQAQENVMIEVDLGRTEGFFTKTPVYLRAIMLAKPSPESDIALLHFRGAPGVWRFTAASLAASARTNPRGQVTRAVYKKANITFVSMDCPSDQLGGDTGPVMTVGTPCLDGYRSSKQHADDVRTVMKKLREDYGIKTFYIQGHSFGTVSSRWLAKNLGSEIAGSIHSASINVPSKAMWGYSLVNFPYQSLLSPQLHVHHQSDGCGGTPYAAVKAYAGENLVTVRGGLAQGDPCGGGHLHSFEGRDGEVAQAIADWILTKKINRVVGEE
jgi:hypothetical protein